MSGPVQPIRYGMFIMPFHDPAKPLGQCYDEDLELIVRAEELNFSEFWIGEHHTMKFEPIIMPEIFIARALGEEIDLRAQLRQERRPRHRFGPWRGQLGEACVVADEAFQVPRAVLDGRQRIGQAFELSASQQLRTRMRQ